MQQYSMRVTLIDTAALRREGPPGKPRAVIIADTLPASGLRVGAQKWAKEFSLPVTHVLYSDTILLAVSFDGLQ